MKSKCENLDRVSTMCSGPVGHMLHLQSLPASGQLQLDVLLSQVARVFLRLQSLLQSVLITAEGQSDLREGRLEPRVLCFNQDVTAILHEHTFQD